MTETETKVAALAQELMMGAAPPGLDENLLDYGFDSLDTVEIVMLVEEAFKIELDDADLDDADTVRKIAVLVDKTLGGNA